MTKNSLVKIAVFSVVFLAAGLMAAKFISVTSAASCPANTEVRETQATLVGEITDTGGDPDLKVWFQYGKTTSYTNETSYASRYGTGLFCATIYSLESCTTYNYRAVAKNNAGTSYGENKSFTTKCAPVSVDIKVNSSQGPITVSYKDYITLSWTSQNVVSCEVSGDWSGSRLTSGSERIQMNFVKTYTFNITCRNADRSQTTTDSVQVIVIPKPPVVITKPAVVTH